MAQLKKIPEFKSFEAERAFWASRGSTAYIDWKKAMAVVLPNLNPSLKTISLRLPGTMLNELKLLANKKDVPYQPLLKIFLSEKIREEMKRGAA